MSGEWRLAAPGSDGPSGTWANLQWSEWHLPTWQPRPLLWRWRRGPLVTRPGSCEAGQAVAAAGAASLGATATGLACFEPVDLDGNALHNMLRDPTFKALLKLAMVRPYKIRYVVRPANA